MYNGKLLKVTGKKYGNQGNSLVITNTLPEKSVCGKERANSSRNTVREIMFSLLASWWTALYSRLKMRPWA